MEKVELKKGERKFIEYFEEIHKEKPPVKVKAEEKIKETLGKIKEQIAELPEIKREIEFHEEDSQTVSGITNILAQAINLAIEEGVEEGLKFISKTNNPHLIDAFHDILIAHFLNLIKEK